MIQLKMAGPVLASLNIQESVLFYEHKLGFKTTFNDDGYGVVVRDSVPIHFWKCDDKIFPENTSCYLYLEQGIEELYAEYQKAGVLHPKGALTEQPWGMREFAIVDNFGNLIRIGQESIS